MKNLTRPLTREEVEAILRPLMPDIHGAHKEALIAARTFRKANPEQSPGALAYNTRDWVIGFLRDRLAGREKALRVRWRSLGNLPLLQSKDGAVFKFNRLRGYLPCFNATEQSQHAQTGSLFDDADDFHDTLGLGTLVHVGAGFDANYEVMPKVFAVRIVSNKAEWRIHIPGIERVRIIAPPATEIAEPKLKSTRKKKDVEGNDGR